MICKLEAMEGEVGHVSIPRTVGKAYFASECGKRAIARAESKV